MGIEDELNEHLQGLPPDTRLRTRQEMDSARLFGEFRQLLVDIAQALGSRGIPTETIFVRSPVPTSKIKHYFLGDDSNPLVPAGQGWTIIRNWMIDTTGALWRASRKQGCEGEWLRIDLSEWQKMMSRPDPVMKNAWLHSAGHQIDLIQPRDAPAYLALSRSRYTTGEPDRVDEIRAALLEETAKIIARYR